MTFQRFPLAVLEDQPDGDPLEPFHRVKLATFTDGRVVLYGRPSDFPDAELVAPQVALVATLEHAGSPPRPIPRTRPTEFRLELADGTVWRLVKCCGCGCTDPVKRYRPR